MGKTIYVWMYLDYWELQRPWVFSSHSSGLLLLSCSVAGVGTLSDGPGLLDICHLPHTGYRVQNADEPGKKYNEWIKCINGFFDLKTCFFQFQEDLKSKYAFPEVSSNWTEIHEIHIIHYTILHSWHSIPESSPRFSCFPAEQSLERRGWCRSS